MNEFLRNLAEEIYEREPDLSTVTVIFPNRRAAIYFRKYLSEVISKPVFSPQLLTFEGFVLRFSTLKIPDKLELVYRLHQCYKDLIKTEAETFDQFFMWGEMLLRDFDEADRYLVDSKLLFADLSHLKELDAGLDYLTEEQKKFLKDFWQGFDEKESINKKKFIEVWQKLFPLYQLFNKKLAEEGLGYEGKIHKTVAEDLANGKIDLPSDKKIWFAGFNALTKAEEKIISLCVEKINAQVIWDHDQYYVNDGRQEAGKFFNFYKQQATLAKTFKTEIPNHFRSEKKIEMLSAAQPIGQVKFLASELAHQLKKGMIPEETVIILPDEKLLIPVMHSISSVVEKFNVSMGFPLISSPIYNLIELLVELQINSSKKYFHFETVQAVLSHPYVHASDAALVQSKLRQINQHNWISIAHDFLSGESQLYQRVFIQTHQFTKYLLAVLHELLPISLLDALDKEYILRGIQLLNRLDAVWEEAAPDDASRVNRLKSFLRLFRQYAKSEKIPFVGEPLKGLQIMGVLESRNLDFKNVFMLSLNEGVFPSAHRSASYIPFGIRSAYGLPTDEHQGAIYAYLFYRAIQRAQQVFLFYNSEPDVLGQGEVSRYLQQLMYESQLPIQHRVLHNIAQAKTIEPIEIEKTESIQQTLAKLNDGSKRSKGFSPSSLNTFLDCSLKFYFQYVARIREMNQVQEEIDPRVLGNLLHGVMEKFYKNIIDERSSKEIKANDFDQLDKKIDELIDLAFIETYDLNPTEKITYEGQRVVVREVVRKFTQQILVWDKKYAPFQIEALEQNQWSYQLKINHSPGIAIVGGTVDRIDRKQNQVRIIDYKTGKDELEFKSIESLFSHEGKRNKAVFQTFLYALLYKTNSPSADLKIIPGLLNRNNLFDDQFRFGLKMNEQLLTDATPLLPEFEEHLKKLVEDIFDPTQKFVQTSNAQNCEFCPYQEICYR